MKRVYTSLVREYLKTFPCVALLGVRQCGKTTLLESLPARWTRVDLERGSDHAVLARDPDAFFQLNSTHVAIDEAQILPEIFPALRVAIDARRHVPGRFVITGSSSPDLVHSVPESLAGRVGLIEMAPFSWEEVTGTSRRDSFLQRLQNRRAGAASLVEGLTPRGTLTQAHRFWFRGGFPEPWVKRSEEFRTRWVEQYIRTYL